MLGSNLLTASTFLGPSLLHDSNWITGILVIILVLLAIIFALHRRKIILLLSSLFLSRYFSQLARESRIFTERVFLLDLSVIFLTQALFCYLLLKFYFPYTYSLLIPFVLFLVCVGAVIFDYLFKLLITYFFTYLFDYEEERVTYYSYKLFYLTLNSFILFIILALVVYTGCRSILLLYIPIFLITFSTMSFRLFVLNSKKINPFHFFIYFCTFEILPYLIVVKVLFLLEHQAF